MLDNVTLDALLADPLVRHSIDVLKRGQSPNGALVASPSFPTYRYAWLRDGAFCARALDVVGETASAAAFHAWAARSVELHRPMIDSAIDRVGRDETPPPEEMPPARYTLEGRLEGVDGDDPWPNFQIDGYGMWLWALEAHLDGQTPEPALAETIRLVARYLAHCWTLKCFSCWEEYDDGEHAATLAAVVSGIEAASRMLGDDAIAVMAEPVRERLLDAHTIDGRFRRGPRDDRVDGSLLWLSVPFGILPPEDPRITSTIDAIHRDIVGPGGGVYRYRGDTYYGGGQWLLLSSSLAWHESVAGNTDIAAELRGWVRGQAVSNGDFPEQVTNRSQVAEMIDVWVRRWGPVATPLLWSHAMFLLSEAAAQ